MSKMLRVLNVAEKNDAAKGIAHFLSNGRAQRRDTFSKFNKIYEFDLHIQLFGTNVLKMAVTSVSGHLLQLEFPAPYRQWQAVPVRSLFEAPVHRFCEQNMDPIRRTLESEARKAQHLIIWTDCDREGENIGFEVIEVCTKVNRRLTVHRAKFSEITAAGIYRAMRTLGEPQKNISDAVECRRELDLRIGAAFTRFQTLLAQSEFPNKLKGTLLSYGSCQFPTLGFVVERYKNNENFVPEPFWKLFVKHTKNGSVVEFLWARIKVFDKQVCETLLAVCRERPLATVEKVTTKPKTKRRPVALETIVLEKSASRKLHIPAKRTMDIAQRLYTKGYISYPRTETNKFPKEIDLRALVELHLPDNQWGPFAQGILEAGVNPHNGNKSDEAHPPIHPIRYAGPQELQGEERRVYEFIVRHFLACLSSDAQGKETTIDIDVNKEKFSASGLIIIARNYLEVYPYDVWSDKILPEYDEGEQFQPDAIDMSEGQTTAPPLLTEADLIALMEKHGIGTDATHAEHIETIKDRRYVALDSNQRFVPGYLGLGLVEGYDSMGYDMSKPNLRCELENDLKCICEGTKQADAVLREQISKYRQTFERAFAESKRLVDALAAYIADQRQNAAPMDRPLGGHNRGGGGGGGNGNDDDDDGGGGGGGGGDGPRGNAGLVCLCGVPAVERTVKKSGPNAGRLFYSCPKNPDEKCNFFAWADDTSSGKLAVRNVQDDYDSSFTAGGFRRPNANVPATSEPGFGHSAGKRRSDGNDDNVPEISGLVCSCGIPAAERTVKKSGPNEGRLFYCCSKSQNEQCGFFAWADGTSSRKTAGGGNVHESDYNSSLTAGGFRRSTNVPVTSENVGPAAFIRGGGGGNESEPVASNQNANLVCLCGVPAAERTVKKSGPNEGRLFYCCSKNQDERCGFFAWADGQSSGKTVKVQDDYDSAFAASGFGRRSIPATSETFKRPPAGKRGGFANSRAKAASSNKHSLQQGVNTNADDLFPTEIRWNQQRKSGGKKFESSNGGGGGGGQRGRQLGAGEPRKCSVCRQPGHTAKNCPQKV